ARLEHPGIGMAEADERDRMAAGLAELQEIASRAEAIELVAIQVRTVPDDGAERADWVRRHRKPAPGAGGMELVAIQVRPVPDDGAERADWVRRHRKPAAPALARQVNDT